MANKHKTSEALRLQRQENAKFLLNTLDNAMDPRGTLAVIMMSHKSGLGMDQVMENIKKLARGEEVD